MNEYKIWVYNTKTGEHYVEYYDADSFSEVAKFAEENLDEGIVITSIES